MKNLIYAADANTHYQDFIFDIEYCVHKHKDLRVFNISPKDLKELYVARYGHVDCVNPDFDVEVYSKSAGCNFGDKNEAYEHWVNYGRSRGLEYAKGKHTALKIILTTKDDSFLIETWIKYYLKLVGKENIVICDNGSSFPEVLAIYEKYDVLVYFAPEYPPDRFKQGTAFNNFYSQVYASSLYSMNVDTDEFLCFYDPVNTKLDNSKLSDFLRGQPPENHTLTSSWLYNNYYNRDYTQPTDIVDFSLMTPPWDTIKGKSVFRFDSPNTNHSHNSLSKNLTFCFELVLLHLDKANIAARIKNKITRLRQNYKELAKLTEEELIVENARRVTSGEKVDHENRQVYEYHKDKEGYLKTISAPKEGAYLSTNVIHSTIHDTESYLIIRGGADNLFKNIFNAFVGGFVENKLNIKNIYNLGERISKYKGLSLEKLPEIITKELSTAVIDFSEKAYSCKRVIAPLKIMLKTKNEPFLLEPWLLYHSNLVGWENLVVLDNASDDSEVLAIYEKYKDKPFLLLKYTGTANVVHDINNTQLLYDIVRLNCKYLCFLDTDEFLTFFSKKENSFKFSDLLEYLNHSTSDALGSLWLYNSPKASYIDSGDFNQYTDFELNPYKLTNSINCGKPLVRSDANFFRRIRGVRVNLCHGNALPEVFPLPGLIVLHLDKTRLYTRIRNNFSLVRSRRLCSTASDLDILSIDLQDLDSMQKSFELAEDVSPEILKKYRYVKYHKFQEILKYLKDAKNYKYTKASYNSAYNLETNIIQRTIGMVDNYVQKAVYDGTAINNFGDLDCFFLAYELKPWMTADEFDLFAKHIRKGKHYYEFGIGGSTVFADRSANIESITALESDYLWRYLVSCSVSSKTKIIPITYTAGKWSTPTNPKEKEIWEMYSKSIAATNKKYDLVFIDGRFRLACGIQSYNCLEDSGTLIVHDYFEEKRKSYKGFNDIYELVEKSSSLAVFKKIPGITELQLNALWETYKHNHE